MIEALLPKIETIQKMLNISWIELELGSEMAQSKTDFRKIIRSCVVRRLTKFKKLTLKEQKALTDLTLLPIIEGYDLSISHDATLGGFALVQSPNIIGFDIEIESRVKHNVVLRISNPAEIKLCGSAAATWVAKEAAFKSFSKSTGTKLIPEVRITASKKRSGFTLFEARTSDSANGEGVVFAYGSHQIGLFLSRAP